MNTTTVQESPIRIPFPKPLLDALDSMFSAKSRELIKDIAKTLRQDEKKLMQAFRAKKRELYMIDMEDPTNEKFKCLALNPHTEVAQRCGQPVVYGDKYCPQHCGWREEDHYQNLPILEKVVVLDEDTEEKQTFFRDALTRNLYNERYERIGFESDTKQWVFSIEEDV